MKIVFRPASQLRNKHFSTSPAAILMWAASGFSAKDRQWVGGLVLAGSLFVGGGVFAASLVNYKATADPNLNPDGIASPGAATNVWAVTFGTGGQGTAFDPTRNGGAWQLYTYPNPASGSVDSLHTFAGGALAVGQTVSLDFANSGVAFGNAVGISLMSGNTAVWTFKYVGGDAQGVYRYDDAAGEGQSTGKGSQYRVFFKVAFTLTSSTTYRATAGNTSWTGTINDVTASPISAINVFNHQGGDASDVYFNNLAISTLAISSLYPDGSRLLQATNALTFNASSSAAITNIQVMLNGVDASSSLVITGNSTNSNVRCPLVTNRMYSASVIVKDANGSTVTATSTFDTFSPLNVFWEAEDYDINSGGFIDHPMLSSTTGADNYYQQLGTLDVDYHDLVGDGQHVYRPFDLVATEAANDTPRQTYLNAQVGDPAVVDYNIGYFNTGEWVNYTRTIPSGTYNIYGRFASGGETSVNTLSEVTNGMGTAEQQLRDLGTFTVTNTGGWGIYAWEPLRDQIGNLVVLPMNGVRTLRLTRASGGDMNVNFFILVPADLALPTIKQVSPLGAQQSTNRLAFVAADTTSGLATNNIRVTLNGTSVSTNLSFSGSATNWNVSYVGLAPNTVYTAVITATNNAGKGVVTTANFDTFSPAAFIWQAEDWDYDGGKFFDAPQTNAYFGRLGVPGVDYFKSSTNGQHLYRTNALTGEFDVPAQDYCGDVVPLYPAGFTNYLVGYTETNDWQNYTRNYPTGTFNIYLRGARGVGGTAIMGLARVTGGSGTTNQTTVPLGSFALGDTGGWQSYQWVPLKDVAGNFANVSLKGLSTLRFTDGGANLNFFTLTPALAPSAVINGGQIAISFGTQSGFAYTIQYKNAVSDLAWIALTTVNGDGSTKSVTDSLGQGRRFYRLYAH